MKKILSLLLLVVMGILVPTGVVLASYDYYVPITVYNNGTEDFDGLSVLVTLNNAQLASLGYIGTSGLDTDLVEGATSRPYLVADSKLGFFVESIEGSQERTYGYRLGQYPAQTNFPFIVGSGGYVTVTDVASLELGNNFSVEFEGWVDTSDPYPTVVASVTSTENAANTTHDVSLPSGIKVGDLLLVLFGCNGGGTLTVAWPSGWTELVEDDKGGAGYKVANGTESSTIIVTTNSAVYSAHQAFRVVDYLGVPEISSGASGSSGVPNSGSLSPSWGFVGALWLSFFGGNDAAVRTLSSPPTSYGDEQLTVSSAGYVYMGSAWREYVYSSENPGQFTLSGSIAWYAWTIGIQGSSLLRKAGAVSIYSSGGGNLSATIDGASPKTVVVTGLTSGEYLVEVWADTVDLGIDIGGVTNDTEALGGVSVPSNANNWTLSFPYSNYYKHYVNGTQKAWFQPVTMVLGTVLTDRSGTGNHGVITWGTNPSEIEVEIGGLLPYYSYVPPGTTDEDIPDVVPIPAGIPMDETSGATGEGLPLYYSFKAAADSYGWSVPTMYTVAFIIIAMVLGVAGLVATGSVWGFTALFGSTAGLFGSVVDSGGYHVMPWFIVIFCVFFAIFIGYVWRYT